MTLNIVRRALGDWGSTYGPPGEGPFPAIMVLHGSEGAWSGWSHRHAVILAAHGFLAWPFGYSQGGNAWNAGSIREVSLDRTAEALKALRTSAWCNGRVGLYGTSRGAEHALLLTSLMAKEGLAGLPDAVAAHSPPDAICGAFDARTFRDSGDPGWRAWDAGERAWDAGERAWTWRGQSESLKPTTPLEVERYAGPLFLSHGTRDQMWSVAMTRRLAERLMAHGREPEVHFYEGQDHIPDAEGENHHHEKLLAFFARHLKR